MGTQAITATHDAMIQFCSATKRTSMYQYITLNVWLIPCAGTEISMIRSKDCSIHCCFLSHHNGAVKGVSRIQYLHCRIVKIMNSEYSRLGYGGEGERQVPFQLEMLTLQSFFAHITGRRLLNTRQHSCGKPLKRLPVCSSYVGWVVIIHSPVFHNSLS